MNLSGLFYKYNLVFNQQIYFYENHNGNCINSIQKSYDSCSNKDPIEATDCDTSRITTTRLLDIASLLNYVKETITKDTIKPTALQETSDVNGNRHIISLKNALEFGYDRSFSEIFVSISTIFPSFNHSILTF